MAEEEQKPQEAPKEEAPRRGVASLIVITILIITLFTGIIAFGVNTGPLAPRGGEATISFVADRAGSFPYMCTIAWDPTTDPETCHPDHKYMTGVLLVLDR